MRTNGTKKTSELSLLTPLLASILPFALWPVEYFLPYPYIIEELVKISLVIVIGNIKKTDAYLLVVASGIAFSFSESILYFINISAVGNLGTLGIRLLLTIPLHVGTLLIMLTAYRFRRWALIPGVFISGALHYLFNYLIYIYVFA